MATILSVQSNACIPVGGNATEKNTGNWEMDLRNNHLYWSPEQYRIYGYQPNEVSLDNNYFLLHTTHPSDLQRINAILERSIKSETGYRFERRIVRKDGSFGFVRTEARIIRSAQQVPVKIIGSTTDIQATSAATVEHYADPKFFEGFYRDYKKAILLEINRWTFDADESDDLCQEVFMKAWHHMHSYDPAKGALYTWLVNIARNHCKDYLKSKHCRQKLMNRPLQPIEERISDSREEVNALYTRELLFSLPIGLRELVDLVFVQGFSQEDVARMKCIPLGTVKTRCRTAIRKLRITLQAA